MVLGASGHIDARVTEMKQIDEPIEDFLQRILSDDFPLVRGCSKSMLRLMLILNGIWERTDTELSFDEWLNTLIEQAFCVKEHFSAFSEIAKKTRPIIGEKDGMSHI